MTQTIGHQDEHMQNATARPYQSPRLLVYGALRNLTASGSTGGSENPQNPQAHKLRP